MEDTLRVILLTYALGLDGLDPCFNGRYSQRFTQSHNRVGQVVLILVLMEGTLRDVVMSCALSKMKSCLNPCSNGRYSQRINESSFRHFI